MSIFGTIMVIIAILWTIVSVVWFLGEPDLYMFLMNKGYVMFIGYIAIIATTVIAKKIVSAL